MCCNYIPLIRFISLVIIFTMTGLTLSQDYQTQFSYSQYEERVRLLSTELPFNNIIDVSGTIIGEKVLVLANGDFIVTGFVLSENQNKKVFILKADPNGEVQTASQLDVSQDTQASSMALTASDGDIIIVGNANIGSSSHILVMRVSSSTFQIQWTKAFQAEGTNVARDVEIISGDILVMCTSQASDNSGSLSSGIIRLSLDGDVLLKKLIKSGLQLSGTRLSPSSNDNSFFLFGFRSSQGTQEAYFGKFDVNSGQQMYSYEYGVGGDDSVQALVELNNGDLVVAGHKVLNSVSVIEIMRVSPSTKSHVWKREMKDQLNSQVKTMEVVNDSDLVLGGYFRRANPGRTLDFASRFSPDAEFEWNLRFFENEYEEVKDIALTNTNVTFLIADQDDLALVSVPLSGQAGTLALNPDQIGWTDIGSETTTFSSISTTTTEWTSLTQTSFTPTFVSLSYSETHRTFDTNYIPPPDPPEPENDGGDSNAGDIWLAVGLTIASLILLVIVILVCIKFKKSVTNSKELSAHDERYKSRSETPMVTEKEHLALTNDEIVIDVTAPRSSQHLIIPPRFICLISHEIMSDPVTNKHKEAFERVCLEFKLQQEQEQKRHHSRSPPPLLVTNNKLKREIEVWLLEQPVELIRKRKALRQKISNWISKRGRENLERDPVLRDIVSNFDAALKPK